MDDRPWYTDDRQNIIFFFSVSRTLLTYVDRSSAAIVKDYTVAATTRYVLYGCLQKCLTDISSVVERYLWAANS